MHGPVKQESPGRGPDTRDQRIFVTSTKARQWGSTGGQQMVTMVSTPQTHAERLNVNTRREQANLPGRARGNGSLDSRQKKEVTVWSPHQERVPLHMQPVTGSARLADDPLCRNVSVRPFCSFRSSHRRTSKRPLFLASAAASEESCQNVTP